MKVIFLVRYGAVSHAKTGLRLKLLVMKKVTLKDKKLTWLLAAAGCC
jgi:hypothetical protein